MKKIGDILKDDKLPRSAVWQAKRRSTRAPHPTIELMPFAGSPNSSHYSVSTQVTALSDIRGNRTISDS